MAVKKVWVISDTHFGHQMLKDKFGRPANFEDQILHALWVFVKPGDLLIHLGDFCMGEDKEWADRYWYATRGKDVTRILVRGNHDGKSNTWYRDHGFDFVCETFTDRYFGVDVMFSHKPLPILDPIDYNVHGHTHGNDHRMNESESFYSSHYHLEVACETLGYCPIELKELLDRRV